MLAIRDAGLSDRRSSFPSAAPAAPAGESDAFAALDRANSGPATTWVHASAHHAEAGFLDPSLGWVSVRADGTGSGVHAAIVPGSPDAASALGTHMAGLNAFMTEHQGHAATVTLTSPETSSAHTGGSHPGNSNQGSSSQDGATSGQQSQHQDRNQAATYSRGSDPASASQDQTTASSRSPLQPLSGAFNSNGNGVHLSVMA